MSEQFLRTVILLGKGAMDKLSRAHVAIFGIGGVGGYVAEALARSGVGYFDLIDNDKICMTNLNRQIIALRETVGRYKVEIMKERILSVNADAVVNTHKCFYLPENADIYKTSVCPLAKVMRRELRKRNVDALKVFYSKEEPIKPESSEEETTRRAVPGSTSFVPPAAGLIIASEVVKEIIGYDFK